jgi:hypothetical protein
VIAEATGWGRLKFPELDTFQGEESTIFYSEGENQKTWGRRGISSRSGIFCRCCG